MLVQSGPTCSWNVGPPDRPGVPPAATLPIFAEFAYLVCFAFFAFIDSRKR